MAWIRIEAAANKVELVIALDLVSSRHKQTKLRPDGGIWNHY